MADVFKPGNMARLDSDQRRKLIPPDGVLDLMDLRGGDVLLDIGAGTGYFAIPALGRVGETGRVIAADISEDMLAELKRRAPAHAGNLVIVHCAAGSLPLPDKTADRILMAFVLHEIDDQERYLLEVQRLLKDGGELTVVEWNTAASPMGPPVEERIGQQELASMAEGAGFSAARYRKINEYQYACVFRKG